MRCNGALELHRRCSGMIEKEDKEAQKADISGTVENSLKDGMIRLHSRERAVALRRNRFRRAITQVEDDHRRSTTDAGEKKDPNGQRIKGRKKTYKEKKRMTMRTMDQNSRIPTCLPYQRNERPEQGLVQ